MTALYFKAIHIIFVVAWFAGLFYLPRLLIYITEAHQKKEPEKSILVGQLKIMASRLLYVITWPAAIITFIMGLSLLIDTPAWLQYRFMHIKLALVALLYGYQFSLQYIFNLLKNDVVKFSSQQLRIWNEVATVILIAVVFLIVLKNALSMLWGLTGLIILVALLMIAIKVYKNYRNEKQ